MTKEILRDKTLDWTEKLLNGPCLNHACWAIMTIAILYFGSALVRIWAR